MTTREQNISTINFYTTLLRLRTDTADAMNLASFLQCPDTELRDALEHLKMAIQEHLKCYKLQITDTPDNG